MKGMSLVNHNYFTQRDVERLEKQAVQIREDIISMIHAAKAGHPGGSLSAVEMVTALYFHVMNIDPQNPRWEDRDRFILSKGHSCPVMYAALARRGYFDPAILNTLRQRWPRCRLLLTLGSHGCVYDDGQRRLRQGNYQVGTVDTTAAGDTFTGYFVACMAAGRPEEECLDLASRAAAIAVSRPGAAPSIPTMDEVQRCTLRRGE